MYIEQTPNPQGPHTLKQTLKTFDLVPTQCTYTNTCWGFELVPIELYDYRQKKHTNTNTQTKT